jgi:hypothetical protein
LSQDFQSLESEEKQSRLDQLSKLGVAGVEPMMAGLVDKDPEVADHATKLIRDLQTQWTTLPRAESQGHQLALINAVEQYAQRFPEPQQTWAASFLNQAIIENVDDDRRSSQQVFSAANTALQHLFHGDLVASEHTVALKPAPNPHHSLDAVASQQPVEPLPLRVSDGESSWTDWPPQEPKILQAGFLGDADQEQPVTQETKVAQASLLIPTVTNVQVAVHSEAVHSEAVHSEAVHSESADANAERPARIEAVEETMMPEQTHVDWATFDTASIIQVLGSHQPGLRNQASEQLLQRGFSETELSVANAIANSDAAYRIELIRQLATQETVDARPWLLLLLRDDDREVKLEAVSALVRFLDPQIRKELRLRMIDETDQKVVLRIRNVLQLSCLP